MALQGTISAQQLTAFVMYVEFVTSASLSVCDQWVGFAYQPILSPWTGPPESQVGVSVSSLTLVSGAFKQWVCFRFYSHCGTIMDGCL